MSTAAGADWEAFVAAAWPGLVRTAALASGDAEAAEKLAERALVRVHAPSVSGWALRRVAPQERDRRWAERARRTVLAAPPAGVAWWLPRVPRGPSPSGAPTPLLQLYRTLEPRQRALLVLTVADGLDVASAAHVLGIDAERAVDELLAGLDRLRGAVSERSTAGTVELDLGAMGAPGESAAGAVDALLSRDPAVRELRETFARLAPVPPVPLVARDAPRRVERAEAADRRSRRRTAAVAACLTLAAVATLSGVARERAQAEAARLRDEQQRAAYAALHPTVLNGDLSVWPTRGSHAEDGPFLASVRASVGAPAALLFAGDVLGLDVAVAVTGSGSDQLLHVHVLSRGPESSQGIWQETGAAAVYPPEAPVVSAVVPDGQGRSHLLVLTLTSGVGVAYSPAPVLKDDATVSRRYVRLPLADGVGIALVDAPPDRLRLRVESAHLEAVETPLVADPSPGATRVPPLGTSVTRAPSCAASPQADVLSLVDDAARHAGLSVAEITSVRFPWCRRAGASGEAAIWMSGARGPDIQCYENVQEATDGLRSSASLCWPVPRGSGPTAPFLAPDLSPSGEPAKDLTLTVSAPGASTAYLRVGPPGSPAIARTSIARDGYGHLVVPATRGQPLSVVEGEGVVVLLGPRGEAMSFLLVSARTQTPSEAWGDGLDGPVE